VTAAADPLHIPVSGRPAAAMTAAYHLLKLQTNRLRVAGDWLVDTVTSREPVHLGLVAPGEVPLETDHPEVLHRTGSAR